MLPYTQTHKHAIQGVRIYKSTSIYLLSETGEISGKANVLSLIRFNNHGSRLSKTETNLYPKIKLLLIVFFLIF